ncbi:hypothetical protein F511_44275 [Dorcoceras hygrometricum]|uniref:NAC domain-containing protein n=1 Tax=Dorcoceras hygrometricum TaxID=472368 RepID=A0A2Z7CA29_9LAMI|nr:hypothetical protein F511_44275 [Dorcoceras hygrometricum]
MERNQQSPTPANPNQEPGPNENAVPKFPLGMRFAPTEEQLICYLRKKIKNEPFEDVCICSVNFYKYNPWELTDMYPTLAKDEWYFFTSRKLKYPNGSRPNRAAGDGYWKATVADQKIQERQEVIGFKKTLVFYHGKAPNGKKTNWIMHEYTLRQRSTRNDANNNMQVNNYSNSVNLTIPNQFLIFSLILGPKLHEKL